jgi:hypothetical protein
MSNQIKVCEKFRTRRDSCRIELGSHIVSICESKMPDQQISPEFRRKKIGSILLRGTTAEERVPDIHQTFGIVYPDLPETTQDAWTENLGLMLDDEWSGIVSAIEDEYMLGHLFSTPKGSPKYETIIPSFYARLNDDQQITELASKYFVANGYCSGYEYKGLVDFQAANYILYEKALAAKRV